MCQYASGHSQNSRFLPCYITPNDQLTSMRKTPSAVVRTLPIPDKTTHQIQTSSSTTTGSLSSSNNKSKGKKEITNVRYGHICRRNQNVRNSVHWLNTKTGCCFCLSRVLSMNITYALNIQSTSLDELIFFH